MNGEKESQRRTNLRSPDTKCSSGSYRCRIYRVLSVIAVVSVLAQWMVSYEQLGSFTVAPTEIKNTPDENHWMEDYFSLEANESENHHHETIAVDEEKFETILWPQLQQKLCPSGLPKLSFGPKLFELARKEFGIPANPIQSKSGFPSRFFDSASGSTLVVDGNDPGTSLLYVRIYKCANNQIRDYLRKHFNQLPAEEKDHLPKLTEKRKAWLRQKYAERNSQKSGSRLPISGRGQSAYKKYENGNNWGQRHCRLNTPWSNTTASNNATTVSKNYTSVDEDLLFFSRNSIQTNIYNSFFRYRGISHKKPCIFTVMRDPISHFLSGYNEIEFRITTGVSTVKEKKQEITFTKIPYNGSGDKEADPGKLREIRFERFVRDLLEENPAFLRHVFTHVYPISSMLHKLNFVKLLPTTEHPSQTWILPSVSNLTETLVPFLADRCPRFVANYPGPATSSGLPPVEVDPDRVHGSASDPIGTYKAAKDVWKKGGRVARSLCTLHAFDYACFYGDNVPSGTSLEASEIPWTCKNVFSSVFFQEAILGA